jgi:hypothetical protein
MKARLCLVANFLVLISPVLYAQTLQQALDAPSLTWTTSGTAASPDWVGQSVTSHDGVSAAGSVIMTGTPGQTTTLQTARL